MSSEKSEACDSCDYHTQELKLYESRGAVPTAWLCVVCASTLAGNACHYPALYANVDVMKQISWCTNKILEEIKNLKNRKDG
mgnify:FL=1